MAAGAGDVPLAEAALLISAALQPSVDPGRSMNVLDELARTCSAPSAEGVTAHLCGHEHFRGNSDNYYDWRNSCLDRVLATRMGIPITLAVVLIEVAHRCGVGMYGVGMPAHFLVRAVDDPDMFFDPFDGGRRLDRSGARTLFDRLTAGRIPWHEYYLDPTLPRQILIRVLNNLKNGFVGRADPVRLAIVMDLRAAVPELAQAEADEITALSAIFN